MSARPELPEELRAMLAAESEEVAPPEGARAHVLDRVFASVGAATVVASAAPAAHAASSAAATSVATGAAKWAVATVALLGALGVAIAVKPRSTDRFTTAPRASTDRSTEPPQRPTTRTIERSATAPTPEAPRASTPSAPERSATGPTRTATTANAPRRVEPREPEPAADALEEEQRLLARGQRALAAGQPDAVLDAVRAHSQRFARGALVEERDALEVRGLLLARRVDEARAKAERFRRRYPDSVFLAAIDRGLREP